MESRCPACRHDTLRRREPRFDGLKKLGEDWVCTACGHRWPVDTQSRTATPKRSRLFDEMSSETPSARDLLGDDGPDDRPRIFDVDDRPERPRIFDDDERRRSCGWCRHRVVNPFAQRCGLHGHEIEATDLCEDFESQPTS